MSVVARMLPKIPDNKAHNYGLIDRKESVPILFNFIFHERNNLKCLRINYKIN